MGAFKPPLMTQVSADGAAPEERKRNTTLQPRPLLPKVHVFTNEGFRPVPLSGQAWDRQGHSHGHELAAFGANRTYSQALSLARAQAAARSARRSPMSPRRRASAKKAFDLIEDAAWYNPGLTRLKEVDPRKVLSTRKKVLEEFLGKSFQSSQPTTTMHHTAEEWESRAHKVFYKMSVASPIVQAAGARTVAAPSVATERFLDDSGGESEEEELDFTQESVEDRVPARASGCKVATWSSFRASIRTDDDSDGELHETGVKKMLYRPGHSFEHDLCDPRNHTPFLQQQVYSARCSELHVHENSGVLKLLNSCTSSGVCYCALQEVSFTNFVLGDRGVTALLPLLTFGRSLRSLTLAGNGMREPSVRQLCTILSDSLVLATLLVLDLSNNPLGAGCADELLKMLRLRHRIIMLGARGTQLHQEARERLLRQSLANFAAADPGSIDSAMRISENRAQFTDIDLRHRCLPLLRELARCGSPVEGGRAVAADGSAEGGSVAPVAAGGAVVAGGAEGAAE